MLCLEIKGHKLLMVAIIVIRNNIALIFKGIWLAVEPSENIIILDVEGTDGRERGEDKVNYRSLLVSYTFYRILKEKLPYFH